MESNAVKPIRLETLNATMRQFVLAKVAQLQSGTGGKDWPEHPDWRSTFTGWKQSPDSLMLYAHFVLFRGCSEAEFENFYRFSTDVSRLAVIAGSPGRISSPTQLSPGHVWSHPADVLDVTIYSRHYLTELDLVDGHAAGVKARAIADRLVKDAVACAIEVDEELKEAGLYPEWATK